MGGVYTAPRNAASLRPCLFECIMLSNPKQNPNTSNIDPHLNPKPRQIEPQPKLKHEIKLEPKQIESQVVHVVADENARWGMFVQLLNENAFSSTTTCIH